MQPFEIHWNDWRRIFIGNVPGIFFIELIIRSVFLYLLLLVSMRLMGKRMSAQLSRNEMASLVSMAAAIGIPIADPTKGLLPATIIALIIILGERLIARLISRNQKFEQATQGDINLLVMDGYLQVVNLQATRIARERIFAELRSQGILQLGIVERMYFEADGSFTLIQNKAQHTGLSIIPSLDKDFMEEQQYDDQQLLCDYCGKPQEQQAPICSNCNNKNFTPALVLNA